MDNPYKGKNILVFGLGLNQGGVGAARFFAKIGANVRVTDLKTKQQLQDSLDQLKAFKNIKYTLGGHKNEDIDWADLIIKNPAIKPGDKYLYYAQKRKKPIETDMGIFFQLVKREHVIGVTGTKGKSTTASLIYEVLKILHPGGAILAGNIGRSVLDTIPFIKDETIVILEISSFQMEGLNGRKVSPKYAVITNIYPDHLNYHSNMNSYIEAKKTIAQYQKSEDYLFLNREDSNLNNPDFLKNLKAQVIFFAGHELPESFKPSLPGSHNRQNYAAALAVCKSLGTSKEDALNAMNKFEGVEFRLQKVKDWHGASIINDTAATSPNAGIYALETYPKSILIAGGMNKGMPYEVYAETVDNLAKKVYLLVGDSTDEIKKLMKKKELIAGIYDDLNLLLEDLKADVKKGDIVLFSPAATSFNLFKNEFDRGRKFNKAVEAIFK